MAAMLAQGSFAAHWPGRLVFGAGTLTSLGDEAGVLGRHALLVSTRDLTAVGVVSRAEGILRAAGVEVTHFEDVQPDPQCVTVDRTAASVRKAGVDLIVAIGGGSALDFGKALSVALTHEGPIWEYVAYTGANARPLVRPLLPVIAVPTTAGSGSEVSRGAVLDNPTLEMKAALLSPRLYPRVALVDPELTYTLPPATTAVSGFDALTHGIESYLNAERSTPVSELFALEAVRRAAASLPRVVEDGSDRDARADMSWAATCGGLAIGLSNTAVGHAMALPLGARLGIAHGIALAFVEPTVLAHTWQAQPERCAVLAEAVGAALPGMTQGEKARVLPAWVDGLVMQIGLGGPWAGPTIDEAAIEVLSEDVFAYMGRPVSQYRPVFNIVQVRAMYEESLRAREPGGGSA